MLVLGRVVYIGDVKTSHFFLIGMIIHHYMYVPFQKRYVPHPEIAHPDIAIPRQRQLWKESLYVMLVKVLGVCSKGVLKQPSRALNS